MSLSRIADRAQKALARTLLGSVVAGKYRIQEVLDAGGFAIVFRAGEMLEGTETVVQEVALKLLAVEAAVETVVREAQALVALGGHPSAVSFKTCEVEDDPDEPGEKRIWLVLELFGRKSLLGHLRDTGPLPAAEVVRIGRQVAAGLAHAHGNGVLHRDVKPSNILLDEEGRAKLTDFGIARTLQSEGARSSTMKGTFEYMAPEQFSKKECPASDVYALGLVLYQMLKGHAPYRGTPGEVMEQHMSAPPPVVECEWPGLRALIRKCLAKSPEDRYRDGAVLCRALEELEQREGMPVPMAEATGPSESGAPGGTSPEGMEPSGGESPSGGTADDGPLRRRRPGWWPCMTRRAARGSGFIWSLSRRARGCGWMAGMWAAHPCWCR